MKHTEGPWKAVGIPYDGINDPCIVSETAKDRYDNEQYVAQTVYDMQSTTTRETVDADTLLIAQAPAMLRALEHAVNWAHGYFQIRPEWLTEAEEVLRKAKE